MDLLSTASILMPVNRRSRGGFEALAAKLMSISREFGILAKYGAGFERRFM